MLFSDKKAGEPMTERDIVAQSITFLLAGYETTSAVLSYLTHLLAHNQNVQKRLSEEIKAKIGQVKYKFLLVSSNENLRLNIKCSFFRSF